MNWGAIFQHPAYILLQPFRQFAYVTTHSPTLPSLYLRHSSFFNPSVASPTSQFILQPFFRFPYVTSSSLNSPGEPPMTRTCKKIHTIHAHIHSNKVNTKGWLLRLNDIRGPCESKVTWHWSYWWGKTPKETSPRKLLSTGDWTRACCVTGRHATACSTAVDRCYLTSQITCKILSKILE